MSFQQRLTAMRSSSSVGWGIGNPAALKDIFSFDGSEIAALVLRDFVEIELRQASLRCGPQLPAPRGPIS
jgi:hypothetical protein